MQSLERIANLLASFSHERSEIALPELLETCGIPQSSGYKLVDALVREGFLQKPRRGVLALGPAVGSFFFTPTKALAPPGAAMAVAPGSPRADGGRSMTRMVQWNSNLLDLVSTTRFRKTPPFVIGFANAPHPVHGASRWPAA